MLQFLFVIKNSLSEDLILMLHGIGPNFVVVPLFLSISVHNQPLFFVSVFLVVL